MDPPGIVALPISKNRNAHASVAGRPESGKSRKSTLLRGTRATDGKSFPGPERNLFTPVKSCPRVRLLGTMLLDDLCPVGECRFLEPQIRALPRERSAAAGALGTNRAHRVSRRSSRSRLVRGSRHGASAAEQGDGGRGRASHRAWRPAPPRVIEDHE